MLKLIENKEVEFNLNGEKISINKKHSNMKTNYFKDCKSLDEAKKLYWSLAKQLHPDIGGTKEAFQDLQNQFESFRPAKEKYKGEFEQWMPDQYMKIIDQLMKIPNIVITICGSWIWISGDTKPVKDQIKSISLEEKGFKRGFSKNKMQWYFSPVGYRKYNKKKYDFETIKAMFGAEEVESEGQTQISA